MKKQLELLLKDNKYRYFIDKALGYMQEDANNQSEQITFVIGERTMKLYFAKEFSPFPYGRYKGEGEHSGEEFREEHLKVKFAEAQKNHEKLQIILDDVQGMTGSFMREAFGKFAKEKREQQNITLNKSNLDFRMDSPLCDYYIDKIWECINEASNDGKNSQAA